MIIKINIEKMEVWEIKMIGDLLYLICQTRYASELQNTLQNSEVLISVYHYFDEHIKLGKLSPTICQTVDKILMLKCCGFCEVVCFHVRVCITAHAQ